VRTRLDKRKASQKENSDTPRPTLPDFTTFLKHFKALVNEQSAPDDFPPGRPVGQHQEESPCPRESLRGKLIVQRERFWSTAEGQYRTPKFFE
jgi:hypothetical protein